MRGFLVFLSISLFGLVNHSAGQTSGSNASAVMAAGTYIINKLVSYTPTHEKKESYMPKITRNGDTLSAIVVAQAQGNNLLRLNLTQYHNRMVQLNFWIGDLTMRTTGHNNYDLYLGTTKMGRIDKKNLILDFGQDSVSTKVSTASKATHIEGTKK